MSMEPKQENLSPRSSNFLDELFLFWVRHPSSVFFFSSYLTDFIFPLWSNGTTLFFLSFSFSFSLHRLDAHSSISGSSQRDVREVWAAGPSVNNPPHHHRPFSPEGKWMDGWARDDWIKPERTVCQNNKAGQAKGRGMNAERRRRRKGKRRKQIKSWYFLRQKFALLFTNRKRVGKLAARA